MSDAKKALPLPQPATAPARTGRSGRLSKSRYCMGVGCAKALYMEVHSRELATPEDASSRLTMDQGTAVGVEARKLYPGGMLIDWDHEHTEEALKATEEAIAHNPPALFEAAFRYHETLVRIDVLKNNGDGTWDLIEVKSSTHLKEEYIPDIAIQRYVAEGNGIQIAKTFLLFLNNKCVFPNLENLFDSKDCTDRVSKAMEGMPERIDTLLATLRLESAPTTDIGMHCVAPRDCKFKDHCWQRVPEHSVFELYDVWNKIKFALYKEGLVRIKDIPLCRYISRVKHEQWKAVRTGKPVFDLAGIRAFVKLIEGPLRFFDFETLNPAIPTFPGLRPYAQFPFQFSCHVQKKESGVLRHFEYLAQGGEDPRIEITTRLLAALDGEDKILAWSADFEMGQIKELAKQLPQFSEKLMALLPRFVDLAKPFSSHYCHPDFRDFSLKSVLPVLVPEMSYDAMDVAGGRAAQVAYLALCDAKVPAEEKQKIRASLLEYCRLDTLGMVELVKWLRRLAAGTDEDPGE